MPDESPLPLNESNGHGPSNGQGASSIVTNRPQNSGGSLLADLLSETSSEAQRELDQIKAELESRKTAELEARRSAERQRREELDRLREAESRRREAALRSPTEAIKAAPAASTKAATDPIEHDVVDIEPARKSNAMVYAIAAVLIAAIGTAGWYFTAKQKAEAEAAVEAAEVAEKAAKAKAAAEAAKLEAAKLEAAKLAAAEAKAKADSAAKPGSPSATKRTTVAARVAASEAEARDRRFPEFVVPDYVKSKRRGKRGGKARGPGKGKIKIRGLNLGTGR